MKISRKNWEASKEKWEKDSPIAQNVRDRKPFDYVAGWNDCSVSSPCGYCWEVRKFCEKCNLHPSVCGSEPDDKNLFFEFIRCYLKYEDKWIIKKRPAYKRSEKLRQRIYKAILADEPNVYEED